LAGASPRARSPDLPRRLPQSHEVDVRIVTSGSLGAPARFEPTATATAPPSCKTMPWRRLPALDSEEGRRRRAAFRKDTRFFLDESVPERARKACERLGYRVRTAQELESKAPDLPVSCSNAGRCICSSRHERACVTSLKILRVIDPGPLPCYVDCDRTTASLVTGPGSGNVPETASDRGRSLSGPSRERIE
jgi:hypothetical protein